MTPAEGAAPSEDGAERPGRTFAGVRLHTLVPIAFYVAVAAFLVIALTQVDWNQVRATRFGWGYLIAATVVGLVNLAWVVVIWLVLLKRLGAGSFRGIIPQLAHAYARSWLGRYIPGPATWVLGKIYFAARLGVPKGKLAVGSFLEAGLQTLVTMIVGLGLLILDSRSAVVPGGVRVLMLVALALGLFALWPRVFNAVATRGYRLVRKRDLNPEHLPGWPAILQGLSMYVVSAAITGTASFLVLKSMAPQVSYVQLGFVIGVSSLTSAISVLAVAVPAGLGVREALLVPMISLIVPTDVAIVYAIVLRVWSVVLDLMFVAITTLMVRFTGRGVQPPPAVAAAGSATQEDPRKA